MEFDFTKHSQIEITQNLFFGIKERDETLSSIVLKLFDILFEKEFDFTFTKTLILDAFSNYEVDEKKNED